MTSSERMRIGKLPPQYTFVLNPYAEYRFTRCPGCEQKMKQRKLPLFIHVDPQNPVILNKTCRYCPGCDLLLVHQDELETLLAALFSTHDPSLIGNDYMVLGTLERDAWQPPWPTRQGRLRAGSNASTKQPMGIAEMLEHLHDFKDHQTVQVQPGGWYPDDMDPAEMPVQKPGPLDTPWKKPARPPQDRPGGFAPPGQPGRAKPGRAPQPKKRQHRGSRRP
jgi:hypothetical protein